MDFMKSEPNCNSETCLTSFDSDHKIISIKKDEDCAVRSPVKMAENVVSDDVCLLSIFFIYICFKPLKDLIYLQSYANILFIPHRKHIMPHYKA
jgi:hypothetical protein